MTPAGIIHLASAISALVLGLMIFLASKGTRLHIIMGRCYVVAMLSLNVSALFIYTLTGSVNAFHVLIPVSLATLTYGTAAAYFKHPRDRWLANHYRAMSWSYIGLVAAAVAESFVRVPFLRQIRILGGWTDFVLLVGAICLIVCVAGGYLVARSERKVLGRLMRTENQDSGMTMP